MEINVFSDYWLAFPNHKLFTKLNKEKSITMWVLFLLFNPTKANPLVNILDTEVKKQEIEKGFVKKKVDWEEIEKLKAVYVEFVLQSRAKKELLFYYEQLEKRRQFIEALEYADNADLKERLLKGTKSIWDEFDKIKEMVDKEDMLSQQIQGGRKESASEQKLI